MSVILMGGIGFILGIALMRILAAVNQIVLEEKSLWGVLREGRSPQNLKDFSIILFVTGISLSLALIYPFGIQLLYLLVVLFLLTGCFWTDFQEGVLLDSFTLGLLVLGLLASLIPISVTFDEAIAGAVLGYGFFWFFNLLYQRFRGVEGMYPGDFKLNAALGACLGWKILIPVLVISLLLLVLFSMIRQLIWNRRSWKDLQETEIPYGCFASISGGMILTALQV